jgi:hypothetical protein
MKYPWLMAGSTGAAPGALDKGRCHIKSKPAPASSYVAIYLLHGAGIGRLPPRNQNSSDRRGRAKSLAHLPADG